MALLDFTHLLCIIGKEQCTRSLCFHAAELLKVYKMNQNAVDHKFTLCLNVT